MPEGDSLRRAAALLAPILEGQTTTEVWFRKLRGHRPRAGQKIENVEAIGKHLLIHFDRTLTLRTHLGMSGSWRAGEPDSPTPRDPRLRVVIRTPIGAAFCMGVPVVDTYLRDGSPTPIDHLGPDLSKDEVDATEVVRRTRELANDKLLAEALLDQRVAAGVGNVFKSEAAFVAGIHPFTRVDELSDEELRHVWEVAHRMLFDNRSRPRRKTTSALIKGDTYVYERFRRPCRRCSNIVMFSKAGAVTERGTYWCPNCQPEPSGNEHEHRDEQPR